MKRHLLLLFAICVLNTLELYSQFTLPQDSGGGQFNPGVMDEMSPAEQAFIQDSISRAIKILGLQNRNKYLNPSLTSVTFNWPLKLANGINDPGFYGISNYIDHNPGYPNLLSDYNCGSRTYDLSSGYNHSGTDIFTWPFSFYKMDNNQVEVIAAADGIIVGKYDGNFDKNCAIGSGSWNAIYLQHSDGTVTWYGHMKNGSLTSKSVGQSVVSGEYLGIVGSSGSSTGPHLHFEVHDALGAVIDPWNGACNTLPSMWNSQQTYYNSQLNKLMTGNAAPVFPACPATETLNERTFFCRGNTIYVSSYYRDQQIGQTVTHKLIQPNSVVWQQWTSNFTIYYPASWWWYSWTLPAAALTGVWKYQITYLGQIYETTFTVNSSVVTPTISPSGTVNICTGNSTTLTASSGNSYNWSNGSTTKSINISASGNFSVTVNNGCGSATSIATTVNVNPLPIPGISSNSPVCLGDSLKLYSSGGTIYSWTGPDGFNSNQQNPIIVISDSLNEGIYSVSVTNVFGCTASATNMVEVINCSIILNMKLFLEGYYTGNSMMDNYGSGGCLYINGISPDAAAADTVTVSAMDATTKTVVDSKKAILNTDGTVHVTFDPVVTAGNSYYIMVNHRNAIETWSAAPVLFSALTSYDFTTSNTQAYGNNMTDVGALFSEPPTWAFYCGDISDANFMGLGVGYQDGVIDGQDYGDMETAVYYIYGGYTTEDITGDGVVDGSDYGLMETNVYFIVSAIRP